MRDAASFSFGELVYEYNTTLKLLLDRHAPLKTMTITLRPTALWYTEELRSEKKKRRALEPRWRSSKREWAMHYVLVHEHAKKERGH